MAQKTDSELTTQAGVIAAETVAGANTKTRVAAMFTDSIDSKLNNDKVDTDNALATASKTVPGRDAVKAYIATAITNAVNALINSAPSALDTLDELAAALGDDANFATTVTNALAGKIATTAIDTANTLDTADKTVPGRDAVKEYIETQITGVTVVPISSAAGLDETAYGKTHEFSGTSSDYQVDLPTAVGHAGETIAFKGLVGFTKVATLAGVSSQTIDGEATRKIGSRGIMVLKSDGTNWVVYHEVGSWIPWTPVFTGFSADPTNVDARYFRMGNKIETRISMTGGTSNATTFTMTMPFASLGAYHKALLLFNGGSAVLGNGRLAAGSNVLTMFTAGSTAFTASGIKAVNWSDLTYEKQ